jgi:predicted RNA-binding Zn-ribbon protein involved in translation (DUF1610 family)
LSEKIEAARACKTGAQHFTNENGWPPVFVIGVTHGIDYDGVSVRQALFWGPFQQSGSAMANNMMACPGCGSPLRVREEYLGRAMKCPRCGQTVQPGVEVADIAPAPNPVRQAPAARPVMLEAVEDDPLPPRPRRRQPHDDDFDVRRRPGVETAYMPCPKCGNTDAERVHFTFWGSFHITNLVCHVQCPSCGTCYNGRTGRSNLLVAVLCVTIPLLLIIAIVGVLGWWVLRGRF